MRVFAVQLDMLHDAVGSRDEKLVQRISRYSAEAWSSEDDYWSDEIADGAPTSSAALRAVIDGGPFDEHYGHRYRWAYQNICEFLFADYGMSDEYFSGFRSGWLEDVGKGLEQLGITTAQLSNLVYLGSPALLPGSEGLQSGEWDNATCRAGLDQWHASTPEQRAALHPEVLGAVVNCVGWMAEVVALSDQLSEEYGVAAFFG